MTNGTIARNTFEAGPGDPKFVGVLVTRPSNTPHTRLPFLIEDNEIVGGQLSEENPDNIASWQVQYGINLSDPVAGTTNVIRRNEITNMWSSVLNVGDATIHDNTIHGGNWALRSGPLFPAAAQFTVNFNRNDILGSVRWFSRNDLAPNYTCNWWGNTAAPPPAAIEPASTPASVYNPRADGPIANNPDQTCTTTGDGGAPGVGDPASHALRSLLGERHEPVVVLGKHVRAGARSPALRPEHQLVTDLGGCLRRRLAHSPQRLLRVLVAGQPQRDLVQPQPVADTAERVRQAHGPAQ
jgi:hypothetical protein